MDSAFLMTLWTIGRAELRLSLSTNEKKALFPTFVTPLRMDEKRVSIPKRSRACLSSSKAGLEHGWTEMVRDRSRGRVTGGKISSLVSGLTFVSGFVSGFSSSSSSSLLLSLSLKKRGGSDCSSSARERWRREGNDEGDVPKEGGIKSSS